MLFLNFFYALRANGLKVSLQEWLELLQALSLGLAEPTLLGFYQLSRCVLVKSEADYDRFDQAFAATFESLEHTDPITQELLRYLEHTVEQQPYDKDEADRRTNLTPQQLFELLERRLQEQDDVHNGGTKWIGTGGTSPLGHSGYSLTGIRVAGEGQRNAAIQVATQRKFRDFREDATVGVRQYQMALRRLRQMSSRQDAAAQLELDLDGTIAKTSENAGRLELVMAPPRKNAIKLLLLFDSGGSMTPYAQMCAKLFQAASKANHFKNLQVYYFHNCPYHLLYKTPECVYSQSVETQRVLDRYAPEYKLILVGDASMALWEMRYYAGGRASRPGDLPGLMWLHKLVSRYSHSIWLNPIPERYWGVTKGRDSILRIQSEVSMYPLSLEGLERGLKSLIARR